MIHKPIYPPKARAREYGDLAINIYTGCPHGCIYCFARGMKQRYTPKGGVCTFDNPEPRRDIVESVKRQLEREQITGKLIHLCFTCDPYPAGLDTTPTREIIKLIKASGNAVQLLTKGGKRAERDFDLLDSGDWFGVTITTTDGIHTPHKYEPTAAPSYERVDSLIKARERGIKTWVSCEPVINPVSVYAIIAANCIDLYRIGKLNHADTPELKAIHDSIDWAYFGQTCVEMCERLGRQYYIKDDLRAEMAKGGTLDYSACPYWSETGCTGFNCCTERHCPYAKESQPILFEKDGGAGNG